VEVAPRVNAGPYPEHSSCRGRAIEAISSFVGEVAEVGDGGREGAANASLTD
jgi:hypothetical protein